MEFNIISNTSPIKPKLEILWKSCKYLKLLKQSSGTTPTSLFFIHPFLDRRNPQIFWRRYPFCYHSCILERDSLYQSIQVWRLISLEIYGFVHTWKHMDNAGVIHRVLENVQTITPWVALSGRSTILLYQSERCIRKIQVSNNAASRSYTKFIFVRWNDGVYMHRRT